MSNRPGIMLYFSDWNSLLSMEDSVVAKFLRASFDYAQVGEWPDVVGYEAALWGMIVSKIDHDADRYEESKKKGSYARYCGIMKNQGKTPLDREEWEEKVYLPKQASTNVNRCDHPHIQQQLQSQKQEQQQSQLQVQTQGDFKGERYTPVPEDEFEKMRQSKQDLLSHVFELR